MASDGKPCIPAQQDVMPPFYDGVEWTKSCKLNQNRSGDGDYVADYSSLEVTDRKKYSERQGYLYDEKDVQTSADQIVTKGNRKPLDQAIQEYTNKDGRKVSRVSDGMIEVEAIGEGANKDGRKVNGVSDGMLEVQAIAEFASEDGSKFIEDLDDTNQTSSDSCTSDTAHKVAVASDACNTIHESSRNLAFNRLASARVFARGIFTLATDETPSTTSCFNLSAFDETTSRSPDIASMKRKNNGNDESGCTDTTIVPNRTLSHHWGQEKKGNETTNHHYSAFARDVAWSTLAPKASLHALVHGGNHRYGYTYDGAGRNSFVPNVSLAPTRKNNSSLDDDKHYTTTINHRFTTSVTNGSVDPYSANGNASMLSQVNPNRQPPASLLFAQASRRHTATYPTGNSTQIASAVGHLLSSFSQARPGSMPYGERMNEEANVQLPPSRRFLSTDSKIPPRQIRISTNDFVSGSDFKFLPRLNGIGLSVGELQMLPSEPHKVGSATCRTERWVHEQRMILIKGGYDMMSEDAVVGNADEDGHVQEKS